MKIFKKLWVLLRETFKDWTDDKAPRLAAALAYYTVFSLAPLLVLAITIAGFVLGNNDPIREQVVSQVQGLAGQQAAQSVSELIDQTNKPASGIIAGILGIATLIFGATGLFGQLQDALNTIWEVKPKPNRGIMGMIKDRFLSFTMVLGISFLLLVSLVISAMLALLNNFFSGVLGDAAFLGQIINFVVSLGVITVIFALIFKVLPDADIAWNDVWVGALVTSVLFNIGKLLIGLYLGNSSAASAYGAAGSLVILLLWVYYSAQILFFGAEFTQVYARMFGSREVRPSENAVAVTDAERANQGMNAKSGSRSERGEEASGVVAVPRPTDQGMIPVVGQPQLYGHISNAPGQLGGGGSRVRYTPRNPNTVFPVLGMGLVAGMMTIQRVIKALHSEQKPAARERRILPFRSKRS